MNRILILPLVFLLNAPSMSNAMENSAGCPAVPLLPLEQLHLGEPLSSTHPKSDWDRLREQISGDATLKDMVLNYAKATLKPTDEGTSKKINRKLLRSMQDEADEIADKFNSELTAPMNGTPLENYHSDYKKLVAWEETIKKTMAIDLAEGYGNLVRCQKKQKKISAAIVKLEEKNNSLSANH